MNAAAIPPRKNILPISSLSTLSNTSKIKGKNGVTNPYPRPFRALVAINLLMTFLSDPLRLIEL